MRSLLLNFLLGTTLVSAQDVMVDPPATTIRCLTADEFDPALDYFDGLKYIPTNYNPNQTVVVANGEDLFPDKAVTDTTTDLFSIEYHNHYKIVTNHFVNATYLLYLCGTQDQLPAEELEPGKHQLVLSIPHTGGVAVTQTPQIPYLELLGVRREMVAYIGDPQWVSSPCMNYMMHEEGTIDILFHEDDPYNSTINQALMTDFLQENPDAIIFDGPYGDKDGDRVVIAAATQERTTVATFDWIGYYAAFFNLESKSNQIAAETKARFDCSSSNAATLSADRPEEEKPLVLWANYFTGYNWSVAHCPSWNSAYYCEYATHCGSNIVSRPEGFGYNPPGFGGNYWYLDDEQMLEVSMP